MSDEINLVTFEDIILLIKTNPSKILKINSFDISQLNKEEDKTKQTILHKAVQLKDQQLYQNIVTKLIENGAEFKKDFYGQSILFYLFKNGDIELINQHFIKKGNYYNDIIKRFVIG